MERAAGSTVPALQPNGEVPRACRAAVLEGDVVTVATGYGRAVWGPHCVFCQRPPDSTLGLCSCGAEYLGDGWWWIPGGEEEIA